MDSESDSLSDSETETLNVDLKQNEQFTPRSYQLELFEHAKENNSILVLGTGSGKTFISIMLIKEMADSIRGPLSQGAKRTVFVANTVPLVHQQFHAISQQTGFNVGLYEGSVGVDFWSNEKWEEELEKNEVLVMVDKIFQDLIEHNRLPISKVNLIILDECHHVSGNHPMREIMRQYNECKRMLGEAAVPRIMGLTACVIHKKSLVKDVSKLMNKLETDMGCRLVTSIDQEMVHTFTTKPKIMFICYNVTESQPSRFESIKRELNAIPGTIQPMLNLLDPEDSEKKARAFVAKCVKDILKECDELGDYLLPKAIKLEAQYLKESEVGNPVQDYLLQELGRRLEEVHANIDIDHTANPCEHLSAKVIRLLEILGQKSAIERTTLIFVTRRNTAKLLSSVLAELKEFDADLSYLLPEHVVGGSANPKVDLKVTQEEIRKQKETIARFRKGECNVIVSTSVLEEGIDVRKCNLVIRFNEPANYRSYVQSLGRARAIPSYYLVLVNREKEAELRTSFNVFEEIAAYLRRFCHNRALPTLEDTLRSYEDDEIEPPFAPYGLPGPQITFNSAISLINRYCGTLPQDKFTNLSVTVRKYKVRDDFYVNLKLPMNAHFKNEITSKPMPNYDQAKKSAALELCRKLFELKVFDVNLMPKKVKQEAEEYLMKFLTLPTEVVEKGKPQSGTKKRRQVYQRKICEPFVVGADTALHLHYICFQHLQSLDNGILIDSDASFAHLGLLCAAELNCCSFPLYSKQWGEVNVIVTPIGKIEHDPNIMNNVKRFHDTISQLLLKVNANVLQFNPDIAGHCAFIVPLTKSGLIDFVMLKSVQNINFVQRFQGIDCKRRKVENQFTFEQERFVNAVVCPAYRDPELYFVTEIVHDENPLSPFPESKKKYANYVDFMKKQYDTDVHNHKQPLIDCKHFSKEFNYLEVVRDYPTKTGTSRHPKFIPELCYVLPFNASLWSQILCMPSILHRINGLHLEQELYKAIGTPTGQRTEIFRNSCLNYAWLEDEVSFTLRNSKENLNVLLRKKTGQSVHPGMILQALTPLNTRENFNLERLELLGDSFLKFSISLFLFHDDSVMNEGELTICRSKIVSNKTLYLLAKERNICELFQGILLDSKSAIPYGFKVPDIIEQKLKDECVSLEHWATYPNQKKSEDTEPTKEEDCCNPWTEQLVADKSIADCSEALIGVYLLTGGEQSAKYFMKWIGLTFIEERIDCKSTAVVADFANAEELRSMVNLLYIRCNLDRLEENINYWFADRSYLIQAVTHPSYTKNKITDCYQRLEFLGDAVLDYLITGYIFSTHPNYNPGKLTDLRSHYVKNETLAKVAVKFKLERYIMHMSNILSSTISKFIQMLNDGETDFNTEDDTAEAEDVEVPKALGDIVESVIGAVYEDSGHSLEVTWNVIHHLLKHEFSATNNNIPIDSVRELYERNPAVTMIHTAPTETEPAKCIIKMEGFPDLTGSGKNKRTAKQAAAKLALSHLNRSTQANGGPS